MEVLRGAALVRLRCLQCRAPNLTFQCYNHENSENSSNFPEEPTTCCMSGCANCVWVEYAEKLRKYFQDGDKGEIWKKINEKVTDPNMRAFLQHELRMRHLL